MISSVLTGNAHGSSIPIAALEQILGQGETAIVIVIGSEWRGKAEDFEDRDPLVIGVASPIRVELVQDCIDNRVVEVHHTEVVAIKGMGEAVQASTDNMAVGVHQMGEGVAVQAMSDKVVEMHHMGVADNRVVEVQHNMLQVLYILSGTISVFRK